MGLIRKNVMQLSYFNLAVWDWRWQKSAVVLLVWQSCGQGTVCIIFYLPLNFHFMSLMFRHLLSHKIITCSRLCNCD